MPKYQCAEELIQLATMQLEEAFLFPSLLPPTSFVDWLEALGLCRNSFLVFTGDRVRVRDFVLSQIAADAISGASICVVSSRPPKELMLSLLAHASHISFARMLAGHIHRHEWMTVAENAGALGSSDFTYVHTQKLAAYAQALGLSNDTPAPTFTYLVDIDDWEECRLMARRLRQHSVVLTTGPLEPSATAALELICDPHMSETPLLRAVVSGDAYPFPAWDVRKQGVDGKAWSEAFAVNGYVFYPDDLSVPGPSEWGPPDAPLDDDGEGGVER